jgi:hypothetical protein
MAIRLQTVKQTAAVQQHCHGDHHYRSNGYYPNGSHAA